MVWAKLEKFRCPACPLSLFTTPGDWVCARDRTPVFINEKGVMECGNGNHAGNVCKWGWTCGSQYHKGRFFVADLEGFVFATSQAQELTDQMGAKWVAELVRALGKQFKK
ncbi:uncharacterized protein LOC128208835 [Mya arenaria]|nr:uncharacterized protein LOC128208835 [Mya arenaria]